MVSVLPPAALEERLIELARRRGVSEGELARELIEASIDDVEMAAARPEQRRTALTAEQARKAFRQPCSASFIRANRRRSWFQCR